MSRHVDCKPPAFYQSIYQAYEAGIQPSPDEARAFEQAAVHKRQLLKSRGPAAAAPARHCLLFLENYYTPDECLDVSSGLKLRPPVPRTRPEPQKQRQQPPMVPLTRQATPTAPSNKCAPPTDPYPPVAIVVTLRGSNRARRRNNAHLPDDPPCDANGTSANVPRSPQLQSPTAVALPEVCDNDPTSKFGASAGELPSVSASAAEVSPVADGLVAAPTAAAVVTAIVPDSPVACQRADFALATAVAALPATIARYLNGTAPPVVSPLPPPSEFTTCEPCLSPRLLIDEAIDRITLRELPGDGSDVFGITFTRRRQFCWRFYLLPAPPGGSWQCFAELALRAVSNEELSLVDSFATRYACPAPEVILYHWQHLWQTERASLCLLPPSCHSVRRILEQLGRADLVELLPSPTVG